MNPEQLPETKRVMIVDDEINIIDALTDILEENFSVISESSPQAALKLLQDESCLSVILCDQRMPHMTGSEFFAKARRLSSAARILVTGYADLDDVVRAVNEGKIFGYLTKPWDERALLSMVNNGVSYHKLERALRHERTMFHDLMRSISDGVFFKNVSGAYTRLNDKEAQLLNIESAETAIGKTLSQILPADKAKIWSDAERDILERGEAHVTATRQVAGPEGEARFFSVNISAIKGGDGGALRGLVGISRDVTEENRIQTIKDEFVSTVSHELRTPITSVQGALALIRGGATGALPEEAARMVEIGYQNCGRLLRLINDILYIGKLDKEGLEIACEPVSVRELLEEAAAENAAYGAREGKRIETAGPAPDVQITGDRGRLLQVLANLVSNALKFSPPGAPIRLRANLRKGSVRIAVIDHGAGIPAEFRRRIFQRFAQADSADTRRHGGAGLGLNISQSIVAHHGGTIAYWSRVGLGTVFYFDLPLAAHSRPSGLPARL